MNEQVTLRFCKQINYDSDIANDIYELLVSCDYEFVPPLSERSITTQNDFSFRKNFIPDGRPYQYWLNILEQQNILAYVKDQLVGFMSFKYNYVPSDWFYNIVEKYSINNYISTICVLKDYRRFGIARKMYEYIEQNLPEQYKSDYISTRTWSSNEAHIKLLNSMDYLLIHRIPNDREFNTIKLDTVYFGKRIKR